MILMLNGVIIKGVGGLYAVSTPEGVFNCAARGLFRKRGLTPIPGDRVEIASTEAYNTEEKTASIIDILPRANEIPRPRMANIDLIVLVFATAEPDFNPYLLDRYLVMAEHAGIPAAVCLNKRDLRDGADAARPYQNAGYAVERVSAATGEGLDGLMGLLSDRLTVFAGPSGAGKSSLINALAPEAALSTGGLSEKIKRGRHTTRHTEILPLYRGDSHTGPPAGFIADTPGFASLDLSGIARERLAFLFKEFLPYIEQCRFSDCLHDREPGCAVREQAGRDIYASRYKNYLNILRTELT